MLKPKLFAPICRKTALTFLLVILTTTTGVVLASLGESQSAQPLDSERPRTGYVAAGVPKAALVAYITIANGNWTAPGTWAGGLVPGSTINAADTVNIGHVVTYNVANDLRVLGTVNITNGTFRTALSGNGVNRSVFIEPGGKWIMFNAGMFLPIKDCGYGCNTGSNLSGNFINKNGTISITNSRVEIAQNWEDTSDAGLGMRTLTGGCMKVGENFLNKGSVDLYDNSCIEIGLHGSGNWENKYRMTYQNSSTVKLVGSGSLVNDAAFPNGVFGGPGSVDIIALGISSGNLKNVAKWEAQVLNFCINGNVDDNGEFLPDVTNNDTTAACTAVNGTNCNSCGGVVLEIEVRDYGDAPSATYQTSLASGGPSHLIADTLSTLFIGNGSPSTDAESDSLGSVAADVDDTTGTDDETFLGTLSIAQSATVVTLIVPVTNTTGLSAQLCGWIDFNIAGGFASSEGRCTTVPSGGGPTATLSWNPIGSALTAGQSYLRLRLSTDPALTVSTPAGAQGNGEVEDHPVTISSVTEVGLTSFNAYQLGESVFLDWKTGYEADNLGFNVYREVAGRRYPVTPSLVAGSALMVGQGIRLEAGLSYAWRDDLAGDASGVQYWLEEVDLNGSTTTHGPFSVTSGESLSLAKRRYLASQPRALRLNEIADRLSPVGGSQAAEPYAKLQFSTERAQPVAANGSGAAAATSRSPVRARVPDVGGLHAVKIEVKRAGWYRVPQDVLVAAGLDGDPRNFQLYADGKQVPIRVSGEEDGKFDTADAVEFYGVGLDIPSTDARVYWLMASRLRGQRMPSSGAGGGGSPPPAFTHTVERKDRLVYVSAILNGQAGNFFGIPLASSNPSVTQALATPNLYTDGNAAATLDVAIQGVSDHQHSIKVTLNGVVLGSVNFAGQQRGVKSFQVAQSQLVAGENLIKLDRESANSDVTLVDSLRLTYQHAWKADSNALLVSAQGAQQVRIGGFTGANVRIIDITDIDSPVELMAEVTGQEGSFAVSAAVASPGARKLYAFSSDVVKTAANVEANEPSTWRRAENRADFLIISHSSLMAGVQPLVELRRSQGLSVALVDVDDIYDEFSYGHKTPEAISDFIRFAATSWKVKPEAVLFVGKATYDPRSYLGQGDPDLVPTQMVDTQMMESAVDDSLADFNNDGIPELAVGRLPVRNAAEALALVAKIIAYELSVPSNRVALISDIGDTYSFDGVSAQLKGVLPAGTDVQEISRGQLGDTQARARVLQELDRAHRIINYVGHGSIQLWRGDLLTTEDASSLHKGNELSLYIMMTCLNGYFISPLGESLSESLLRAQGGAVAVWASSGTTTPEGQQVMNLAAFQQLFGGQNLTIGDAARAAKAAVADADVRRTWNLLGDPTMRLR